MILDKTHRSWFLISLVIFVVSTVSYIIYASLAPNGPSGGSFMGLMYGIIGSLMMIFAGLLAGRKQVPTWTIGSAQFWLRGHLWLGTLSFPLILYHAGFGWGGLVENILWITFGTVILSGFFGLAVQHFLPRFLTSRLPNETFHAQVPFLCKQMQFLSDKEVADRTGQLDVEYKYLEEIAKEVCRQRKLLSRDGDFEKVLSATYSKAPKVVSEKKPGGKKDGGPSPLDQMKAKGAEAAKPKAAASSPLEQARKQGAAGGEKKMSPLEMARAQGAKGSGGAAKRAGGGKKLSPLELARQQGAAGSGGKQADTASNENLSPLELARMQGAAGAGGAKKAAPAEEAPAKKLSPLELARMQGAAGSGGATKAAPAAEAPAENLSPLELARKQGAAGSKKKAPPKTAAEPPPAAAKPAKKKAGPEPITMTVDSIDGEIDAVKKVLAEKYNYSNDVAASIAEKTRSFLNDNKKTPAKPASKKVAAPSSNGDRVIVEDVDAELDAIRKLFTEKYAYDSKLADKIAECSREFLAEPDPDAIDPDREVRAIEKLFTEKYGYSAALATDIAEKTRPFLAAPEEEQEPEVEEAAADEAVVDSATAVAPASAAGSAELVPATDAMPKLERARFEGPFGSGRRGKMPAAAAAGTAPAVDKPSAEVAPKKVAPAKAAMPKKKKAAKPAIPPELQLAELKTFYVQQVRSYLNLDDQAHRFNSRVELNRAFSQMRINLPVELHDVLGNLQQYCEDRRQFRIQERLLRWMHLWVLFHVPISMALFVFFIVHVVMALRVVPFSPTEISNFFQSFIEMIQ